MPDQPRAEKQATQDDEERKERPAPANPPQQNADVDVKTDGGVDDPAAK